MEILKPYRQKIDDLDDQIIDLLGERLAIIHEVSVIKKDKGIPPVLQDRVDEVRERAVKRGIEKGYEEEFIRALYAKLIEYSCEIEEKYQSSSDQKALNQ